MNLQTLKNNSPKDETAKEDKSSYSPKKDIQPASKSKSNKRDGSPLDILKSEKEKVEKGCGKDTEKIDYLSYNLDNLKCGEKWKRQILLCPTCQARLEALNLGIQAVENQIKDDIDKIRELIRDIKWIDVLEGTTYATDIDKTEVYGFDTTMDKEVINTNFKVRIELAVISQLQKEITK